MRLAPLLAALALSGCDGSGIDVEPCGDPCQIGDEHNYGYQASIQIDQVPLQDLNDNEVDWSGLTRGITGVSIDPSSDVDSVRLIVFPHLTVDQIAEGLATETLDQSDVGTYMFCTPQADQTSCPLSRFGLFDNYPGVQDYFEEGTGQWLLAVDSDEFSGVFALQVVTPSSASTDTVVHIDSESSSLEFEASLLDKVAVGIEPVPTVTLDWSGLTRDGLGHQVELHRIDLLEVAHLPLEPDEVEDRFLEIETLADRKWSADVTGVTSLSLDELEGEEPFAGIDGDGTWGLSLRCTSCDAPAPRLFALLRPTS